MKGDVAIPVTAVRFDLVETAGTPASLSPCCRAAAERAAYAGDRGIAVVQTEEHHGVADN